MSGGFYQSLNKIMTNGAMRPTNFGAFLALMTTLPLIQTDTQLFEEELKHLFIEPALLVLIFELCLLSDLCIHHVPFMLQHICDTNIRLIMPWGTFTYGPISSDRSSHSVTYQYEWSIYKPFALQYMYLDSDDGRVIVTKLKKCVMTREFLLKFFQEIMVRLQIKKDMARMKRMMNKGKEDEEDRDKKDGSEEDESEEDD
jgi:hypothetical protein